MGLPRTVCAFVFGLSVFGIMVFVLTFDTSTAFLQAIASHQFRSQKLRSRWSASGSPFHWTRVMQAVRFHACALEPQRRFVTERGKRSSSYNPSLLRSAWVITHKAVKNIGNQCISNNVDLKSSQSQQLAS